MLSIEGVPPQNINAEAAVLGSMLTPGYGNKVVSLVLDMLGDVTSDDMCSFYSSAHEHIYSAMASLFREGQPVDLVSVTTKLEQSNQLEAAGGVAYLDGLIDNVPTVDSVEYYATLVKDAAFRRRMLKVCRQTAEVIFEGELGLDSVVADLTASVYGILGAPSGDTLTVSDALKQITSVLQTGESLGISTGFQRLDAKSSGWQKGNLYLVAGPAGVGKTSLACKFMLNLLAAGVKVFMLSLEMSLQQVLMRMLSILSRLPFRKFRDPSSVVESDWPFIANAMSVLYDSSLIVDDTPGLSISEVMAKVNRVYHASGADIVFLDHMHIMNTQGQDDIKALPEISRGLKQLARQLDIPVVCLAQLNRSPAYRTDKRPKLTDLRGSGALEQDADTVMFVYRDSYYSEEVPASETAEIILAKNRSLEPGVVPLRFTGAYMDFAECTVAEVHEWLERRKENG